jgi:hypothetical protein
VTTGTLAGTAAPSASWSTACSTSATTMAFRASSAAVRCCQGEVQRVRRRPGWRR